MLGFFPGGERLKFGIGKEEDLFAAGFPVIENSGDTSSTDSIIFHDIEEVSEKRKRESCMGCEGLADLRRGLDMVLAMSIL